MSDEVPLSLFTVLVRGGNDFHFSPDSIVYAAGTCRWVGRQFFGNGGTAALCEVPVRRHSLKQGQWLTNCCRVHYYQLKKTKTFIYFYFFGWYLAILLLWQNRHTSTLEILNIKSKGEDVNAYFIKGLGSVFWQYMPWGIHETTDSCSAVGSLKWSHLAWAQKHENEFAVIQSMLWKQ